MSEPGKVTVNLSGVAVETGSVAWDGADGIGLSAQGSFLVVAIHNEGKTYYTWLGGEVLDHVADQLATALKSISRCEAKLANIGRLQ